MLSKVGLQMEHVNLESTLKPFQPSSCSHLTQGFSFFKTNPLFNEQKGTMNAQIDLLWHD